MSSIPGISGAIEVPNTLLYLSQCFNYSIAYTSVYSFSHCLIQLIGYHTQCY